MNENKKHIILRIAPNAPNGMYYMAENLRDDGTHIELKISALKSRGGGGDRVAMMILMNLIAIYSCQFMTRHKQTTHFRLICA